MLENHVHWIKTIQDSDYFEAGDGTRLTEVLHPANDGVELPYSIARASIAVGDSSLPHRLAQDEVYLFLSGEGEAFLEGRSHEVASQSVWLVPRNRLQWVKNTGKEELIFYCIVSPAWTAEGEEME